MTATVDAVFFDVGETLVDETEVWGVWADWLGVPRLTFFAALGAVIARGGDHREVFELFCSGRDFGELRRAREAEIGPQGFKTADLYPDARPCRSRSRVSTPAVKTVAQRPYAPGPISTGGPRSVRAPPTSWASSTCLAGGVHALTGRSAGRADSGRGDAAAFSSSTAASKRVPNHLSAAPHTIATGSCPRLPHNSISATPGGDDPDQTASTVSWTRKTPSHGEHLRDRRSAAMESQTTAGRIPLTPHLYRD